MEDFDKKSFKKWFAISLISITIIGIILTLTLVSKEMFEDWGQAIMVIFTACIVYALFKLFFGKKTSSSDEQSQNKDSNEKQKQKTRNWSTILLIVLGIVGLFLFVFTLIATNKEVNRIVGMTATAALIALITGFILYKLRKW